MQDSAHYTDSHPDAGSGDVDDTAYRHMPRLCQDAVRMMACIGDRTSLIGTRSLLLSCAELCDWHGSHSDARRAFAVESQLLRHGGRGIDDPAAVKGAAIIDHRHRFAAIAQIADSDPRAERQGLVRHPHRPRIEGR